MSEPLRAAPVTRCYLARHCDVANPDGVLYGHLPNFPLSPKGRQQAATMGLYLASRGIRTIYASPLERAQETAALVSRQLRPPAPILERQELVEAEFGRYLQGTRHRDVLWRKPRWFVHLIWPGLVPGDESMAAMAARVQRVISEGLRDHPGEAFVCVSHGDPIQAFWATSDRRMPWALHRLQCSKGGLLELDFLGQSLTGKRYLSPQSLAAAVSESAQDTASALVEDSAAPV
ncbi:MAG TPA: histidine phosphatase family protein [Candidatus Dormibacteraeota bacterium]|nr:histidine phosphatase family protein [Candidatus Dormibacteraeota bacterium]